MARNNSIKRRIMDYLASGKTLTASEAQSRFGCANFRATISDIKSQVERYNNWAIGGTPPPTFPIHKDQNNENY